VDIVRWILSLPMLTLSAWLIFLNWTVFWRSHVQRIETPSWIPFMGGVAGGVGVLLMPIDSSYFWLVPFLLDWGSIPGITYSIFFHIFIAEKI
jgi:hypothetical protein